jgi:fructose-specific phosphotransferase system IIC component
MLQARHARKYGPAAAVTLMSAGVMMLAGWLFHASGWSAAWPVMIGGGALISLAFVLARRAGRPRLSRRPARIWRLAASLLTLAAGAVLVLAGYAAAAWNPLLVLPAVIAGGVVIAAAFVVDSTSRRGNT